MISVLLISSTACGVPAKTRYEASFLELFDTETKIVAYMESKEEFTRLSQLIYDNLKEYHQLYDIYNNYPGISDIKTINDNAGIKPVKVDRRIIDLLLFGKEWYKKTGGKKNIAMGSVLSIWLKYREAGIEDEEHASLPPVDMLKEASKHMDINKVLINEADSTVYLEDPKMSLDVGAIAKGYATERVSQIAIKNGFTSGLISVGGNVRAIGCKGDGKKLWNLGIQNPDRNSSQTSIKIVYLADMSVVTSGDYERYYIVNGKRYHHIIDPDTLFPSEYYHAVTIITKDSGIADALSAAVFIMPFEEGLKLIESMPDTAALWVMQNGEIRTSKGLEKYEVKK
jgi:thiamine biosynthesis lipoprotein